MIIDPKTKNIKTRGGTSEKSTLNINSLLNPNGFGTAGAIEGLINAVTKI